MTTLPILFNLTSGAPCQGVLPKMGINHPPREGGCALQPEGSLPFFLYVFRGDIPGLGKQRQGRHIHTQLRNRLPPREIFKWNGAAPHTSFLGLLSVPRPSGTGDVGGWLPTSAGL